MAKKTRKNKKFLVSQKPKVSVKSKSNKKKKSRAKPEKKEVFYVGVQDPVEVRRNILEVSRDMVQFLQQNQKLTSVRNEKTEAIKHLRQDVADLKTMINKLRRALPKTKLRIKLHQEHEVFRCERCDKELSSKKNLQKHMETHVKHRKPKASAGKTKSSKKAKKSKSKSKSKTVKVEKAKPMKAEKKKIAPETQAKLTPPETETRKPMSEIEKLESELADIENKLGRLS